ncbi:MAG: translation initiation factor IF-2 subunit gamma [Nitrososphaeria archaeon]|nr:translation initiation factor IF-2 subunit gamma [Nitrososphaeria archaeon]
MYKIPRQPEVNIGTAGHVDHGKTTLVQALTGKWASTHSEELKRGITIRVGYADAAIYKCPKCSPPSNYSTSPTCSSCNSPSELVRVVSFVDCPGHESLMANMLSGAALMDGAILVIAADEKVPQPQTSEHLAALDMLGKKNIVIVQNKVDLVDDKRARENYLAIKNFVKGTVAENAPIIPVSAAYKLNVDALIEAIERHIPTPVRDLNAPPLMQVLRSFDVNKPGTDFMDLKGGVLGGSLIQGQFMVGDEIKILPGVLDKEKNRYTQINTVIKSLSTSAGLVDKVTSGGLVAIGTNLDPSLTKSDSLVGSVVCSIDYDLPAYDSLTLKVNLFKKVVGLEEDVPVTKIAMNEMLRLNVWTAVTVGLVSSARSDIIEVKLRRPVAALSGARVAIARRIGDRWRLIGSGIIE